MTGHPPTQEELEDIFRPEDDERALAEIRRVLEVEEYERLGHVILSVIERQRVDL